MTKPRTIIQCMFYLHPCCLLLVQLLSALLALCVPTMATDQQRHAYGSLFIVSIFHFFPHHIGGRLCVPDTPYQTRKNKCNQAINTWSVSGCGKQKVFSWCSLAWPSKSKKKKHFKKTEETLEEIEKYIKSLY